MNAIRKTIQIFSYVIIGFGFIGFIVCGCSSDKLDIVSYTYKNSKLNSDEPFKVAIISDYHHRELNFANCNMIDAINNLGSMDAIFFTGDLIDAHTKNLDDINKIFEACNKISNNLYYVTGNHEEYAPLWPTLRDSLTKNNVKYLDNKKDVLTFTNKNVCIYGLEDPRFASGGYKDGKKDYGKSKEYLDKFNPSENTVNILLAHRPELVDLYSKYNFDYICSGHSHGGQVRIGNWTPWSIAYGKDNYVHGQYKVNNSNLIVSAGLGYSAMFPLRINCNPEIVTISISK